LFAGINFGDCKQITVCINNY